MPSWKKILQSGSAAHVTNITASGLPNTTQANVVGITSTGQFTYFSTSSLVSGGSVIGGSGTQNYITRWSGNTTITTSSIYESGGNIGIGTTSPQQKLHVSGGHVKISNNDDAFLEIITSASKHAYIDLVNSDTYPDYGLRLIREPNGTSYLYHRGTGDFGLHATESANILFYTTNLERMRITDSGSVGIGTNTPNNKLQVDGGITAVNITASNLPQVSQPHILGYDTSSGRFTYFSTSSFVGGSGTQNYITRWSGPNTITTSSIYESGSRIGIGTGVSLPISKLHIYTNQSPYIGLFSGVENTGGTIISASAIQTKIDCFGVGNQITNAYNINILNSSASEGTITNLYGVHVNLLNSGSSNWAIYTSGSTRSYFGGNVGLNVTNPSYRLQVKGNSDTDQLLKVEGSTNTFIEVNNGNVLVSGSNVHLSGSLYFSASSAGNVSNSVLVRDNTTGQIKLTGSYGGGGGGVTLPSNLLSGSGTPTYIALYSGSNFLSSSNIFQNSSSFIGIGTTTPSTLLQVGGRFSADLISSTQPQVVVFNSTTKELTYMSTSSLVAGAGGTPGGIDRDIQFNDGGAFGGAGSVNTFYYDKNIGGFGQGDNVHVGVGVLQTHAQGFYTSASANYSHAEGANTTAFAEGSHAEGYFTLTTSVANVGGIDIKDANYSHAEGAFTTASAPYSHAEGSGSSARGDASHAEGRLTIASGSFSHAEGGSTNAGGIGSHAEGASTTALGQYSHAEGFSTLASGTYSHAEGYDSEAKANNSHAEGNTTIVYDTATSAHTEGQQTRTYSVASHAEGYDNQIETNSPYSHVEGAANLIRQDSEGSHAEGYRNVIVSSEYSHAEGEGEGDPNQPEIKNSHYSHTEGSRNTIEDSLYSHAEGDHNTIDGGSYSSHAEGSFNTITSATGSHAEGNNNLIQSSNYSHVEGIESEVKGADGAHAEGYFTKAWAKWSHTAGSGSFASPLAIGSYVAGEGTISSGSFQHVIGRYNIPLGGTGSFIIGNGTSAANRSNIMYVDLTGSSVQITGSLLVQGTIAATNISGNISSDKITAPVGNTTLDEITTAQVHSASFDGDVIFTINGPYDSNAYKNWIYVRNKFYENETPGDFEGIGIGIGAPPSYSLDVYGESNFGGPNEYGGPGASTTSPPRNNNTLFRQSYGFAHGQLNEVYSLNGFAQGKGLIVSSSHQHAIGSYNQQLNQDYSFVIGNGGGTGTRSNTLVAYGGAMAGITPQVQITGSFSVTPNPTYNNSFPFADVKFQYLSQSYRNHVLTYDEATGQIYYFSSSLEGTAPPPCNTRLYLASSVGTDNQSVSQSFAITNIVYNNDDPNASVSGLPSGITDALDPLTNQITIFGNVAPTAPPRTYTYVISIRGGCKVSGSIEVVKNNEGQLPNKYTLSGSLLYDNTAKTGMSNSYLELYYTASNSTIGAPVIGLSWGSSLTTTVTTNSPTYTNLEQGYFEFTNIPPGEYILKGVTNKPWGGVTATDALVINRSIVGAAPLVGLRLKAADVNGSNTTTSVDALLVARRGNGSISTFAAGAWVSEEKYITITSNTSSNVLMLCVGDVNGSYTPSRIQ